MRGLWKCKDSDTRQMKETAGYKWVKTGYIPPLPKGCGKWNVYISTKTMKPKVIDAVCKRCGRRMKFQPKRQDNRGKVTPVSWLERPGHMPKEALIQEMIARNRREDIDREIEGFKTAAEMKRGGSS